MDLLLQATGVEVARYILASIIGRGVEAIQLIYYLLRRSTE
jgi:hypothetical protein